MWQRALEQAQADAQRTPGDAYAWFNLGSSLAAQGRTPTPPPPTTRPVSSGCPGACSGINSVPSEPTEAVASTSYRPGRRHHRHGGQHRGDLLLEGQGPAGQRRCGGARQNYRRAVDLNSNYPEAAAALAELGG